MRQVFVIHGGDAFSTYEEYISYLRNYKLDIERLRGGRDWKSHLAEHFGSGFDVFTPSMPNARNAKYLEWRLWFEKFFMFMQDDVVLVGHSLGGIFLAKYLSENKFPKKIAGSFLVAPPYDDDGGRPIPEFTLPQSLQKLNEQGGKIFLYQSKDDQVVSFAELAKYQAALPSATVQIFEDRGHFNQETFPEIVEDIKGLV